MVEIGTTVWPILIFIVHMLRSYYQQNLTIWDEFDKRSYFVDYSNICVRMLKLGEEFNWFHTYLQIADSQIEGLDKVK